MWNCIEFSKNRTRQTNLCDTKRVVTNILADISKSKEQLSKQKCPECGTLYRKGEDNNWYCSNCNRPMHGA